MDHQHRPEIPNVAVQRAEFLLRAVATPVSFPEILLLSPIDHNNIFITCITTAKYLGISLGLHQAIHYTKHKHVFRDMLFASSQIYIDNIFFLFRRQLQWVLAKTLQDCPSTPQVLHTQEYVIHYAKFIHQQPSWRITPQKARIDLTAYHIYNILSIFLYTLHTHTLHLNHIQLPHGNCMSF
jgi:hypothetical protein